MTVDQLRLGHTPWQASDAPVVWPADADIPGGIMQERDTPSPAPEPQDGPVRSRSTTARPARSKPKSKIRWGRVAAALVVVVVAAYGCSRLLASDGAKYTAVVSDFTAPNPDSPGLLAVTLKVTNTGSASGTPTCIVTAHDPTFADQGVNSGQLADPVAVGATATAVLDVTISHSGAAAVTDVTVSCS